MSEILPFAIFSLGVILPPHIALIFGYLAVRSVSWMFISEPQISVGHADLWIEDIFYLGIIARVTWEMLLRGRINDISALKSVRGIIFFWAIMLLSTLFSVGTDYFPQQMISLLRFLVLPLSPLIFVALWRWDERTVRQGLQWWRWTGYAIASTIYLGMISGVGEVNLVEEGAALRYQGLLGDSVKLALLPFVFSDIARGSILGSIYLIGALLFTGGRFGIIGLLVGLIFLLTRSQHGRLAGKGVVVYTLVPAAMIFIGVLFNAGGLRTRFFEEAVLTYGIGRRVVTWEIGLKIGMDHWIVGTGFNGYRFLYPSYLGLGEGSFPPFETEAFSQVIKAFVDGGIIGVVAFPLMMYGFWKDAGVISVRAPEMCGTFLTAVRTTVFTFTMLSPFVVWLNPGGKVGFIFMTMLGMAIQMKLFIRKAR